MNLATVPSASLTGAARAVDSRLSMRMGDGDRASAHRWSKSTRTVSRPDGVVVCQSVRQKQFACVSAQASGHHLSVVQESNRAAYALLDSVTDLGHVVWVCVLALQKAAEGARHVNSCAAWWFDAPHAPVLVQHFLRTVARHVIKSGLYTCACVSRRLQRQPREEAAVAPLTRKHNGAVRERWVRHLLGIRRGPTRAAQAGQPHHERVPQAGERDGQSLGRKRNLAHARSEASTPRRAQEGARRRITQAPGGAK